MKCPFCGCEDTQVKDSRETDDATAIRRRRECAECGSRFTTFERIQLRDLIVVKKNGDKVMFDRDKLARSIYLAVRKRPVSNERVEKIVTAIQRRLESSGETEIQSTKIGEYVMEVLPDAPFPSFAYSLLPSHILPVPSSYDHLLSPLVFGGAALNGSPVTYISATSLSETPSNSAEAESLYAPTATDSVSL